MQVTPALQRQLPKETEASETIYESAAISVIENKERGGIEVRFAEKPSKDWTAKLKTQSFRFSNKDSDPRWWRKASKVSVPAIKKFAEDYDSAVREKEATSQDAADTSPIEESPTPEKATSSEQTDNIRPVLRIYLETKAEHPDSIVLVRTPIGLHETFMDDAKLASNKLGTRLGTIDSNSDRYGRVSVNRIFQEKLETSIEELRQLAPVVVRNSSTELSTYPKLEETQSLEAQSSKEATTDSITVELEQQLSIDRLQPTVAQRVKPSYEQTGGRAERAIATFLDEAGLSEIAMSGNLHMTVRNEGSSPLLLDIDEVESVRALTFTQQIEHSASATDRLMTYAISGEGLLTLQRTAFRNPSDATKTIKGCDRPFATSFTNAITRQNFREPTLLQVQNSGPESGRDQALEITAPVMSEAQSVEPSAQLDKGENQEPKVSEAVDAKATGENLVSASKLIQAAIEIRDPSLAEALTDTEPTVEVEIGQLRQWYRAALAQQKSSDVLETILEKGMAAKEHGTTTLNQTEVFEMNAALQAESIEVGSQPASNGPKEAESKNQLANGEQLVPASKLIQLTIAEHDPQLTKALTETEPVIEVKVEQLRQWYEASAKRQRPSDYLEAIEETREGCEGTRHS